MTIQLNNQEYLIQQVISGGLKFDNFKILYNEQLLESDFAYYLCRFGKKGNIEILNYLIKQGLDIYKKDDKGMSLFFYCYQNANNGIDYTNILLTHGLTINSSDATVIIGNQHLNEERFSFYTDMMLKEKVFPCVFTLFILFFKNENLLLRFLKNDYNFSDTNDSQETLFELMADKVKISENVLKVFYENNCRLKHVDLRKVGHNTIVEAYAVWDEQKKISEQIIDNKFKNSQTHKI